MAALHVLRRLQGARRRGGRETPTSGTVHLGDALIMFSSEKRKQPQKKFNVLLSVFFKLSDLAKLLLGWQMHYL
jgi:hypothetical protein